MSVRPPLRELSEARIRAAMRLLSEFESQVVRLPAELQEALAGVQSYCRVAITALNHRWTSDTDLEMRTQVESTYYLVAEKIEELALQLTEGTDDITLPADLIPTIQDWLGRSHAVTLRTVTLETYRSTTIAKPAEELQRRLGAQAPQGAWSPTFWTMFDVPRAFRRMFLRHLVVLGHEAAHAADVARGHRSREMGKELALSAEPLRELGDVIGHWIGELVADIAAVRRVGPAALVVMGEMSHRTGPTGSHPPPELRLDLMAQELDVLGYTGRLGEAGAEIEAWGVEARSESAQVRLTREHELVLSKVKERLNEIQSHARELVPDGECYTPAQFEATAELADDLVEGIARSDRCRDGMLLPESIVDLYNAALRVRVARLDKIADLTGEPPGPSREVKALETLDRLLARAIEGVYLARAWNEKAKAPKPHVIVPPPHREGAVLSKEEIDERIRIAPTDAGNRSRRIVVTPLIDPHVSAGGTLDLRLGRHFIAFRKTRIAGFDLLRQFREEQRQGRSTEETREELAVRFNRTVERIYVPFGDEFVLHPYQLVLAATIEYVALPADVGAHVLSRSSTGRLGILSATATYVHPGFTGVVTLELVNTGETAVTIAPGMRIAQFLFVRTSERQRPTPGRYFLSTQPEISRLAIDEDLEVLAKFATFSAAPTPPSARPTHESPGELDP